MPRKRINKKNHNFLAQEKYLFFILSLAIILASLVYPLAKMTARELVMNHADRKLSLLQRGLSSEKKNILGQTKRILADNKFVKLLDSDDFESIIDIFTNEYYHNKFARFAISDKNGLALVRYPSTNIKGDYLLQTTSWGRQLRTGHHVADIAKGKINPLIMISGLPLPQGHDIQGALFVAYAMGSDYASFFKQRYLGSEEQLVFYSKETGVTGSTFEGGDYDLITSYFSVGSDWLQISRTDDLVKINDKIYFVKNLTFPDPENIQSRVGGVLLFIPYPSWIIIFIPGILSFLFIFLIALYLHRRNDKKGICVHCYFKLLVLFIALLFSFVHVYFNQKFLYQRVIDIRRLSYIIYNSTLSIYPDNDIVDLSSEQYVKIMVDSGGEAINAIQVSLNYEVDKILVEDILTDKSFCRDDFFLEKKIDQDKGNISIICVVPSPGFSDQDGILAELLIRPLKVGDYSLKFTEDTMVLANDGLGTNVLRSSIDANYLVEDIDNISGLDNSNKAPLVYSSTHPNSERWYNKSQVRLFWPDMSDSYIYAVNQTENYELDSVSDKIIDNNYLVKNIIRDGVYFFHIATWQNGKVGVATHFKAKVDITSPESPKIFTSDNDFQTGDILRLEFKSFDKLSGLQNNYYVSIDNSVGLPSATQLYVPLVGNGRHTITVRVFDKAGNYSESSKYIQVK